MGDVKLKNLNPRFRDGSILVRASRVWEFRGGTDEGELQHIDLVFIDSEGVAMYGEISKDAFYRHISTFTEGKIYRIRRFTVSEAKPRFRPVNSEFMIRISVHTIAQEYNTDSINIPLYTYRITKFSDIEALTGETRSFIDVMGLITEINEVEDYYVHSQRTMTIRRLVTLRDTSNYELRLYLWGQKASEFDADHICAIGQEKPVVAIFVGLLVKSFQDGAYLSANSPARWYINLDTPGVSNFIERVGNDFSAITIIPAENHVMPSPEGQPHIEFKTVQEIRSTSPYDFPPEGFRTTVTVSRVNQNVNWFFASCNRCNKGCFLQGNSYRCGSCNCTTSKLKYKICLYATDGTAEAEFIFFGEMGRLLVNRDIGSLIRNTPRPGDTPPQIASLVSHKFQLTVNITSRAFQRAEYSYQVKSIDRVYGRQGRIPQIQAVHEPYNVDNKRKRKIDEESGPSTETPLQLTYSTASAQATGSATTDYMQPEGEGTPIPTILPQESSPSKNIEQSTTLPANKTARTTDTQQNKDSTARKALFTEQSPSTQSADTKIDAPIPDPAELKSDTPKPASKDIKLEASHQDTKKSITPKRSKKT